MMRPRLDPLAIVMIYGKLVLFVVFGNALGSAKFRLCRSGWSEATIEHPLRGHQKQRRFFA